MSDWKAQLEQLNKKLVKEEQVEMERRAATLKGFRQLLLELEPIVKTAQEFGDAFGVDCAWQISRYDDRYPYLEFRLLRPALEYRVECRDGEVWERLREGLGKAEEKAVTLEELQPDAFAQRITQWVQSAANANRKVPGKRR